ncbi:DnaB-like helicase C-terminal domain-containing protein [Rhizobium sp. No.120]
MNEMPNRRDFMDRITEDDAFAAAETFFACMFADNSLIDSCGLEPEDFAWEIHQTAYRFAAEDRRRGQPVNTISLKPRLPKVFIVKDEKDRKKDIEITPAVYLSKLFVRGTDPSLRNQYDGALVAIKSMSLSRRLLSEAQIGVDLAGEGHNLLTLGDEIEQLEARLKDMRSRFAETTAIVSPGSSYLAAFQASARRDGVIGVPIALTEIAKVLSEPVFEAGNLYGLLSSSGEGKSSLTMQLIYHAVYEGHPVLFLSYDQSPAQCVRQMIAQVHEISVRQQREPMRLMSQVEQDRCVQFATWINEQPFEIIRCQREGVDRLVTYARRFIKKRANGKTPFIVIDHISKVKPRDPKLSPDRISGEVTVELKSLADETGSAVLILNQRNGQGTIRDNPRPISRDLYGGEGARADYDAVLTLYRPEKYKQERMKVAVTDKDWALINKTFGSDIEGIAEIASIKVRFGDPSIVETLKFEAEYTRYRSNQPERTGELF